MEPEWNVRTVLYGDGSVGACRLRLEYDSLYASGALFAGHESYYEVDIGTFQLCDQGELFVEWPVYAVTKKA